MGEFNLTGDRKPKIFYGYIIVLAGFCIGLVIWGIFNTFGVFFNPLLDEFGWTRATLSTAASLASLIFGFFGIIVGRLNDRIGPRLIMVGCGVLFGLGYLLMSQVNTVWQLYLFFGVIVGLGTSGGDVVLLSTVARWFVKRRGMMSGIVKVGTGLGMLIMPLVASWLISSHDWRVAYIIIGIVALVSVVSAAQFLKRDPAQKGLSPYGAGETDASNLNSAEGGFSLREAIHNRPFQILCALYALVLFSANTILVHIVPHAIDLGIAPASAARILATIGGVSMAGRIVMGSVSDRVGGRKAMIICSIVAIGSLVWLQSATELWMLYLFAVIYGFAHGGFFTIPSPLVAELFGLSSHGAIFGTIFFAGTIGGAIGSPLAGYIFDVTGSYQLAFLICVVASVVVFILALLLRPVGKERR